MTTLLEKATAVKKQSKHYTKIPYHDDFLPVAVGWVNGEIDTEGVNAACGLSGASYNHLYRVALALRNAIKKGKLKPVCL